MKLRNIFLLSISFLLLLTPFLIWGNTYIVGGDDTKLYYLFPKEFLANYVFNIISDNTLAGAMTGYASVSYFAPLFFVIYILSFLPFVSTQMVLYGLNLSLGFLAFYYFLKLWIKPNTRYTFVANIFASFFYVSSIFLAKTLYNHQLLAIYLVSVIPSSLYFLLLGIRKQNLRFILISVLILSIFSSTLNTFPWLAAFLITSIPILVYELFFSNKHFVKGIFYWVSAFVLLNFYWIFHVLYPFINPHLKSVLQYYSTSNFIQDNVRIITGVIGLYHPINVVLNSVDRNILENISPMLLFNITFFAIIVSAGIFANTVKNKKRTIYIVSLSMFLISWYLFSPDIGAIGQRLYIFLAWRIPYFTMFRNMYDKFALPLAFSYAFALSVGLSILIARIKSYKVKSLLLLIVFCSLVINTIQSVHIIRQNDTFSYSSGRFNNDFMDLVTYLKVNPSASRILWLPLNSPTYINIEDKHIKDSYYSGLSPLRVLANRSDYSGKFSFITTNDLFKGDLYFSYLTEKKYVPFAHALQRANVTTIIVDNQALPKRIASFMYGGEKKPLLAFQGKELQDEILGKKLRDFGSRYSLYEINQKYMNDKLYLTKQTQEFTNAHTNMIYRKLASYEYELAINNLSETQNLVFLDPYYKDWVLYLKKGNKKVPFEEGKNFIVHEYANGWKIDPSEIKKYDTDLYTTNSDDSINVTLNLFFKPQYASNTVNMISSIVYIAIMSYLIYPVLPRRQ